MMKPVTVRLPEEMIKDADELSEFGKTEKSVIFRTALLRGLEELKREVAIKLFSEGDFTSSEAAEFAEVSMGEFIETISKRGIKFDLDEKLIKESMKSAKKLIK